MKFFKLYHLSIVLLLNMLAFTYSSASVIGPLVRPEQPNPGLKAQVKILPMVKINNVTEYSIETVPTNATLYYDGEKIETGFSLIDPNRITIDPEDGNVTAVFSYTSNDGQGNVSKARSIIMRFYDLRVAGSVFYDFDGNSIVDGERISNLDGLPLFVTLVNKEEEILASKAVSQQGRYLFTNRDGIQPNTNYAIVLSTKKDALTSVLLTEWGSSGENINSLKKGKDIHSDGTVVVKVREKSISDVDFGVDIRPLAKTVKEVRQLNPGGTKQVSVPQLKGSDKEDGKKVRFYLLSLPESATLYENGKSIKKAGVQIKHPEALTVDPKDSDQTVNFKYVTVDVAGVTSHTASVTLPFLGLKITGSVYNDGLIDGKIEGKLLREIEGKELFVTLLDDKKKILTSKALNNDGHFIFDGTDGVTAKSIYFLVLSTEANATESDFPENWSSSGESIMQKNTDTDGKNDALIKIDVESKDVDSVNFGINKKPEAYALNVEAQLNPGAEKQVSVPTLRGNDNESAEALVYRIESLPANATLYASGKKVETLPFAMKDPAKVSIDPKDGDQHIEFTYEVIDGAGSISEPVTVTMDFKQLSLSGHLFNDGNADNNVSGPALSQIEGKVLYILLLNKEKKMLASKSLEKDGTYAFTGIDGVSPENIYFLALATEPKVEAFGLPEGWNHTGEKINAPNHATDSAVDGVIAVKVKSEKVSNIDFGINQKPLADNKESESELNPGLDTQVPLPVLSGKDRESGINLVYTLSTLPKAGTLYYDAVAVDKVGFTFVERAKLTFDPENGEQIVHFSYTTKDEAGVVSDPATVKMTFKELHIRGRIVDDGSGKDHVKGTFIKIPKRLHPYATLLDDNNTILASNPLRPDASFEFSGEDGVRPYANFTVVISLEANASTSVLPSGWEESGEGLYGKDDTKDSQKDGRLTVYIADKDINTLTFGINKKPTADPKKVKTQINPGAYIKVPVPKLTGSDRESGTHLQYRITSLPNNALLYSKENSVKANDIVDPSALSLDPKDGKQIVTFSYVSVDQEGILSEPVTVSMHFKGLRISGSIIEDFIIDGQVDSVISIADDKVDLFVNLLNEKGEVLSSVPVIEGKYRLDETHAVNANTTYTLVLSTKANVATSTLPAGWNHADGENVNSLGKGNDGKADGMLEVHVKEKNVTQADFGVNYLIQ